MNLQEAQAQYGHLNSIRSAIDGLIEAAQTVQEQSAGLLGGIYSQGDKLAIQAMRNKTMAALDELKARELRDLGTISRADTETS